MLQPINNGVSFCIITHRSHHHRLRATADTFLSIIDQDKP